MAIPESIGVTFSPTNENAGLAARRAPREVQQAIQVLSMRLPSVAGARALAPQELLAERPGGGGEDIASAVVQSVLRSVLGGGVVPAGAPAMTLSDAINAIARSFTGEMREREPLPTNVDFGRPTPSVTPGRPVERDFGRDFDVGSRVGSGGLRQSSPIEPGGSSGIDLQKLLDAFGTRDFRR